jgi:lipoprotein-anchoring transpeptidase ErfK/SrfK
LLREDLIHAAKGGLVMTIGKSMLRCASVLTTASAVLWIGMACAAPPLPQHAGNPAARFAPVIQDPEEAADGNFVLAANLRRQLVGYPNTAAAGTIIIDTAHTYLYYVLGNGQAIRYGIGVGRDGFTWSGSQSVTRMAEWPDWTPPKQMIARQPYLPRFMAGGKGNPLGARAIYLGSTVYRIHGTNAPQSIGTKVSSGCIRLTNADVADLYSRVTVGTEVIVLPSHRQVARTSVPARTHAPLIADLRATGIY